MGEFCFASRRAPAWRVVGMAVAALLSMIVATGCSGTAGDINVAVAATRGGTTAADAMHSTYRLRRSEASTAAERSAPALAMRGRGRQGRIVDAAGRVLWHGSDATPLYGLELSPDGRRAILYFGNADYSVRPVADMAAGMLLPTRPARVDASSFGEWHWLDDDRLLGVAGIPAARLGSGATAAEIESQPPEATLLSVYDLRDSVLAPVEVGDGVPAVFEIGEIRNGNIELRVAGTTASVWTALESGAAK